MHSIHIKHSPVNQIKTKCFKELHQENGATSEWHVAFSNIHCSENVPRPSLCIYINHITCLLYLSIFWLIETCSLYIQNIVCCNQMTNTRFIEVHPENGGKRDNLFSNIPCAESAPPPTHPTPSICILMLSTIFHIWNTFIASGCLKQAFYTCQI